MAKVFDNVNGIQLEKFMAMLAPVQGGMEDVMQNIASRAEHNLQQAGVRTGVAHIETLNVGNKHRDRYVVLVDSNVNNEESELANSALSIEFGRVGYTDENGVHHGAMTGLAVLHDAADLPMKKRKKSAAPKFRKRPNRGARGRFV